tara:strand:- start:86 stop:958 length:873 start_codon:yes stop_codon:yes gene_type:complete
VKKKFKILKKSTSTFGFILIILTYLIWSIMELIAKDLGQRYDSFFIVFVRYISQLIFLFIIFNKNFSNITKTKMPKLQIGRGALLMMTTCFMFAGLATLPFAEHIAVYMIGPILTTILAIIFLKEKVSIKQVTLIVLGLLGALIIANPTEQIFNYFILLPFMAALCFSFFIISTKFLNTTDNPSTTLVYTAISGTILSIPLAFFFWETPSNNFDILLMLSMGIFVTAGHFCFIKALKYINASVAAPFVNLTLILAAFWGYFLYNEVPSENTYIGSVLIVTAGIMLTRLKK